MASCLLSLFVVLLNYFTVDPCVLSAVSRAMLCEKFARCCVHGEDSASNKRIHFLCDFCVLVELLADIPGHFPRSSHPV